MGKKSGPLAFLNKKGWHPGNLRNMEKVWKKEQEALAEQKQVEELRKQYEEARQKEEVEAMAVAAGVKKKQERLDWMYQGGMVAKQEAEKRADAQLLGDKEVEFQGGEEQSKGEQLSQLPSFYTTDTPASANEMWQRMHGDPMLAIKQQELMARKKIVSNPVQMDAIRKSLADKAKAKAARKAAKAQAKAERKAAKKAKKEKKHKREKQSSSSSGDGSSASEDDRSAKRPRTETVHADPTRQQSNGYHRKPSRAAAEYTHSREHSERHGRRAEPDSRHTDSRERGNDARERESRRRHESHGHEDRPREHSSRDAIIHDRRDSRAAAGRERPNESAAHVRTYHDSASAQPSNGNYGISHADGRGAEDRDNYRRETERRLEEAARRKEAEEKEKAAQRYQRKEYKTGKLSEEEKAKRLAEMTGNADVHEEARWARLHAARKRDDSEEALEAAAREKAAAEKSAPGGRHHQDTARFLNQATKEVYGGEAASLADRIGRRKYYNDRNRDEGSGAFQH